MKDCIVVGGGIIGSTVAKALRNTGMDVVVFDDYREGAGTKPSGGHLKPSWFGSMPKNEYEPAMELLGSLWEMYKDEFVVRPTGLKTTVYRVDTDVVVAAPKTVATVVALQHLQNFPVVSYRLGASPDIITERCRMLVIATGVWVPELFPDVAVQAKKGVSFRIAGKLDAPFIKPWSPYKQIVAHQQSQDELWVGDGSAILEKNWTEERTEQCKARCREALPLTSRRVTRTITGLRAYTKHSGPCLLERIGSRTWIATGAGKSGTIAAGWVARKVLDATI